MQKIESCILKNEIHQIQILKGKVKIVSETCLKNKKLLIAKFLFLKFFYVKRTFSKNFS